MLLVMSFIQVKIRIVGGVIDQICHHDIFSNVLPILCFSSDCRGIKTTPIMRKHSSGLPRRPVYISKGYRLNGVGKMAKFAQIEAATFKAISTLHLCELDVLRKTYLSEIWKLDSEIFMSTTS